MEEVHLLPELLHGAGEQRQLVGDGAQRLRQGELILGLFGPRAPGGHGGLGRGKRLVRLAVSVRLDWAGSRDSARTGPGGLGSLGLRLRRWAVRELVEAVGRQRRREG